MPSDFRKRLENFLALETVAGNLPANSAAIQFLKGALEELGFEVEIHGQSQHGQPIIVARRRDSLGSHSLVLYNHYDVEKINAGENWNSPPFTMTEQDGRWFARGIADNKAVLLARLEVVRERLETGLPMPNILWLIQGEEEVGAEQAHKLFPALMGDSQAAVFLEETGYYRDGAPLLFHQNDDNAAAENIGSISSSLNQVVFSGEARIENRTLSKFGPCPFVNNLPAGSHYIGFGPNDYSARIHRDNESMDIALLKEYQAQFHRFMDWFCENWTTNPHKGAA